MSLFILTPSCWRGGESYPLHGKKLPVRKQTSPRVFRDSRISQLTVTVE